MVSIDNNLRSRAIKVKGLNMKGEDAFSPGLTTGVPCVQI